MAPILRSNQREHANAMPENVTGLLLRIMLVMLIVLVVAGIMVLIFPTNLSLPPTILKWTTISLIGLFAGLAARLFLPGTTRLLRMLVAILAIILSFWVLGWITQGFIGVRPPSTAASELNWLWLLQLALAGLLAFLALYSWKITVHPKKTRKSQPQKTIQSRKTGTKTNISRPLKSAPKDHSRTRSRTATKATRVSPARSKTKTSLPSLDSIRQRFVKPKPGPGRKSQDAGSFPTLPSVGLPAIFSSRFWALQWDQMESEAQKLWKKGQKTGRTIKSRLSPPTNKQPVQPYGHSLRLRGRAKTSNQIHLASEVEHRCPYCLDLVMDNDPRGVKVCSECKTHHHADCWAVTGTCQVPHQHK